jgi:hypothetical protein
MFLEGKKINIKVTTFSNKMKNDLGIDPDEWFDKPITDEYAPSSYEPLENPDESDEIEASKEDETIHERMYQMAIKNGNTITMGGSENVQR